MTEEDIINLINWASDKNLKKDMKKEDIDRLKEICEKEGFELKDLGHADTFVIKPGKKDPWDGVEFAYNYTDKKVYRISSLIHWNNENRKFYNPSTEHEYISQLITECNEKLGDFLIDGQIQNIDFSEMKGGSLGDKSEKWEYRKDTDTLYYYGHPVYQQRKWAKKKPEKPTVQAEGGNINSGHFYFIMNNAAKERFRKLGCWNVNEYLASQLEKYLNKE